MGSISKQAAKNARQKAKQEADIKNAVAEFDKIKHSFVDADVRLYNHLCAKFSILSDDITKYLFLVHREAWVLMSVDLDDPSKAHDDWTIYFVRTLKKIGPDNLKELSNANPSTRLFQLVQKWHKDRRRKHFEKCKAERAASLRKNKLKQHAQKIRAAKPVLPNASDVKPTRPASRCILQQVRQVH
jgi:hypothetical protein